MGWFYLFEKIVIKKRLFHLRKTLLDFAYSVYKNREHKKLQTLFSNFLCKFIICVDFKNIKGKSCKKRDSASSLREKSVFHEYLPYIIATKTRKTSSIPSFSWLQCKTNIFVTKLVTSKNLIFLLE